MAAAGANGDSTGMIATFNDLSSHKASNGAAVGANGGTQGGDGAAAAAAAAAAADDSGAVGNGSVTESLAGNEGTNEAVTRGSGARNGGQAESGGAAAIGGANGAAGTGGAPRLALSARDFTYGRLLGLGSYSKVVLARRKPSKAAYNEDEGCPPGSECALKIMDKRHIVKERKVAYIKMERLILDRLRHPGIVRLLFTFQDEHSLYMGLECCHGGELFDQIRLKGKLSEEEARFYAAEVVCALEYMHSQGVVHRDLKPENILLTAAGHVRISDFGCAKLLTNGQSAGATSAVAATAAAINSDERSGSFVGTAEYVPPELLDDGPVSFEADLWALGCIIYQMLAGVPPFKGASEYLCFQKILSRDLTVPNHFSNEARSLVNCLLVCMLIGDRFQQASGVEAHGRVPPAECPPVLPRNPLRGFVIIPRPSPSSLSPRLPPSCGWQEMEPKKRLGSRHMGGYPRLKAHPFFRGIPWGGEPGFGQQGVSSVRIGAIQAKGESTGEGSSVLFSSPAPVLAVPVRIAGNDGLRGHGLSDGDGFGSGVKVGKEGGEGEGGEDEDEEDEEEDEWAVLHLGGSFAGMKVKSGARVA
ncbi:unnamed protein product [Closterium sp. NIES-65]|nr:unnamed protein product [Closterium sp. NIES-65]